MRHTKKTAASLTACLMSALLIAGSFTIAPQAQADEETDAALAAAQSQVESTTEAYYETVGRVDALESQIAENQQRIDEIQASLPAQREASNNSLVALYKQAQQGFGLIDMILGSGSISEFFQNLDYVNRMHEKNAAEVKKLASMENELVQKQSQLQSDYAAVEQERNQAEEALAAAQQAREAAQAAAEQKKQEEAAAAAAAAAEAEAAAAAAAASPESNTGSNVANEEKDATIETTAASDGANWSTDKASFVAEWAPRIDAYLSGTPLGGQGTTFASAAWDYGVDPRWSPAISYVESSCGLYCFRDHNAWGWGSAEWDSWEEAIDDHVAGLSRGYGYTISVSAAQKYCPPNWQHWYNSCCEQMDRI